MDLNHSKRWYNAAIIVCSVLLILIMFRREARERAKMNELEGRIVALESYVRGLSAVSGSGISGDEALPVAADAREKTPASTTKQKTDRVGLQPQHQTEMREEQTRQQEKFGQVVRLELNTVDSATLVRIPGIGASTTRAILAYRSQLGGYCSPEQIREKITWESAARYMDEWCRDWFWADERFVQKMAINKLSFKELLRHPYLDYEQVKGICNWRERHKNVRNAAELMQAAGLNESEMERLKPYIDYEMQ